LGHLTIGRLLQNKSCSGFKFSFTPADLPNNRTIRSSSPWIGLVDWHKTAGLLQHRAKPPDEQV
jgi:hypothetical protein